ncbi:MAG: hypothetical protein RL387_1674 [Bacteroidota bacterium]|jgi:hypothetical protein
MQHLYWKQIIACCIAIILSVNSFGQYGGVNQPDHDYEKFWSGLYFGIISSNYQYTRGAAFLPSTNTNPGATNTIQSEPSYFIHGGIPVTFRIYKNLLARTGTSIILNSDITNSSTVNPVPPNTSPVIRKFKTSPIFFQIPIAIKYESDRYDLMQFRDAMRHYVFAGATLNYDFSTGSVNYNSSSAPNPAILKPYNFTYDIGLGLTFTINDFVRISPELKLSYGINNLIKPGVSGSPLLNLDKVTGNYVSFSLHIEN